MDKINKFIIEKLKVSTDTVIKQSFASRHRNKHIASRSKINKFRKFFEDLIEMSGLRIAILASNKKDTTISLYKIRENEPDKPLYNSSGLAKSYKQILYTLFDETQFDWNDEDDLNMNNWLCLDGFDDDELRTLEKLGFKEEELYIDKSRYDSIKDNFMIISIKDLYNNIDKIYSAFFE